jgi:hypothetical protein
MGTETFYTTWHLTPNGWIPEQSTSPPPDRVETWQEKVTEHDVYGNPCREWKLLWASTNHSDEHRKQLRAKCRSLPPRDGRLFWDFPS